MGPLRLLPPRPSVSRPLRRRLRSGLRRQPIVFWALVAVAVASSTVVVGGATRSIARGADAYGSLVPVIVADVPLEAGQVVGPDHVSKVDLPAALIPTGALREAPLGHAVRHPIVAGEAVVLDRLADAEAVGIAVHLGPDDRAVAVPLPSHRAPVVTGQVVDVMAVTDPGAVPGRISASVLAEQARVIDVSDGGITVAVTRTDAAAIVGALPTAVVDVVVHPG